MRCLLYQQKRVNLVRYLPLALCAFRRCGLSSLWPLPQEEGRGEVIRLYRFRNYMVDVNIFNINCLLRMCIHNILEWDHLTDKRPIRSGCRDGVEIGFFQATNGSEFKSHHW